MKPPAFQFYADDFIGGTVTMSHEERGLYILLLALQWTQGGISPGDFDRLSSAMAQPSRTHVLAKFDLSQDGRLRNARMEREREKQQAFRASRSESGKVGAQRRWHSHGSAMAQPMANGMAKDNSPSPSPSPNTERELRGNSAGAFPSLAEVTEYGKTVMATADCCEAFWNAKEGDGWTTRSGHTLADWRGPFRNWAVRWKANDHKNASSAHRNGSTAPGTAPKGETAWSLQQRIQAAQDSIGTIKGIYQTKNLSPEKQEKIRALRANILAMRERLAGLEVPT